MKTKTYKGLLAHLYEWAIEHGCYRKPDDDIDDPGGIDNYFTVRPGKKGKPCFSTSFPDYVDNWPKVKQASYEDDYFLTYKTRMGWFFGNEHDLGLYLAQQHKGNETRIANLDDEISYLMFIGDNDRIQHVLNAYNSKREKELGFQQVQQAIREFHLAMGIPYQEHIVSLLDAPLDDGEE
jgi:hypothetical protein